MLEITLCWNKDIIPTWCVRKFVSQLTHFEKNIYSYVTGDELCMNKHVTRSISCPTPFVKTCNEKLKWDMDVDVRTYRYDMYEYTHVVFFL
jgi:hypothetical protein